MIQTGVIQFVVCRTVVSIAAAGSDANDLVMYDTSISLVMSKRLLQGFNNLVGVTATHYQWRSQLIDW